MEYILFEGECITIISWLFVLQWHMELFVFPRMKSKIVQDDNKKKKKLQCMLRWQEKLTRQDLLRFTR